MRTRSRIHASLDKIFRKARCTETHRGSMLTFSTTGQDCQSSTTRLGFHTNSTRRGPLGYLGFTLLILFLGLPRLTMAFSRAFGTVAFFRVLVFIWHASCISIFVIVINNIERQDIDGNRCRGCFAGARASGANHTARLISCHGFVRSIHDG
eukprot:scaffold202_cov180-Amphora_coffeaeformis.AAC.10